MDEHGPFMLINLFKTVSFHSYVTLPEGMLCDKMGIQLVYPGDIMWIVFMYIMGI